MQLAGEHPVSGPDDIGICILSYMQDAIRIAPFHGRSLSRVLRGSLLFLLAEEPEDGTAVPDSR